jgi:flagellar M-ring protein FliF
MAAVDVDHLKQRAIAAYRAFSPAQLVLAGLLTVVTVVGGLIFYSWVSAPTYSVLFSGLAAKDTADVTAQLTTDKVAYKLTGNGTTVEVPAVSLDKERVALASAGLPKGGTGGWETLDKEGLTTSSFRQTVDYQRALEGEIAKTLQSMDGVDAASVHLVLPAQQLFTDQQQHARASIMLTTRRTLTADQVQAVIATVSSAVSDLDPSAVTVTDNSGRLLSSRSGGADDQSTQQAAFEDGQTAQAQSMLDQLVGAGHSVVRVSATLNFDKTHSTVKTVDPTKTGVTASDKTTETYTAPGGSSTSGVLTTTTTTPALPSGASGASNYQKQSQTSTTDPSEQLDDTQKATGGVTRQSVAVVLDTGAKALPPNAMVQQLVAAAVGLDPKRGDTIVVSSSAFDTGTPPVVKAKKSLLGSSSISTIVAVIMLLLITLLLARAARRPKTKPIELALPTGSGGSGRAALPAGQAVAALTSSSSLPAQRNGQGDSSIDLLQAVEAQPDDVAHLLRGWLTDSASSAR